MEDAASRLCYTLFTVDVEHYGMIGLEENQQASASMEGEPVSLYTSRTLFRAMLGIAIGAAFLWLVVRGIEIDDVLQLLLAADAKWLVAAVATFALNMAIRVLRWQRLLAGVKELPYKTVSTVLLIGYAVNNVLPARIGELYRAHFAGRNFGFSRATALASIMVERTMDGLLVVALLAVGQFFVPDSDLVQLLMLIAGTIFIGFAIVLVYLGRKNTLPTFARWPRFSAKIGSFQDGVSVFRDGGLFAVFLLSSCVWLLEALSVWCILNAIGVSVGFGALALITSVATLATLLPSSPAYIGTYQYAYVFAFGLLGHGAAEAVAASTAAQVLLLGSVTVVGLGLYIAHNIQNAMLNRPSRTQRRGELT
jgi:glycosyltransferase 2 family protein